jgi:hypothetical protein
MKNFRPGREAQERFESATGELFAPKVQYLEDTEGRKYAWLPESDITARKHGGNPQSVEAHKRIRKGLSARREAVYEWIEAAGKRGITVDEMAVWMNDTPNAISGRFSELARNGRIIRSGRTRKTRSGCSAVVWIVAS